MIRRLMKYNQLILEMTKRDVLARYKGSYLGILWSFVTPLLILTIYTFVFSVIFQSKWNIEDTSHMSFGITLFAGMIIINIFTEVLIKSTSIIVSNPNYVTKVVFPLEIFPIVIFMSALIHACISFGILIIAQLLYTSTIHWTVLLIPIILIPLALFSIGIGWIFSSLGVFVRDLNYMMNIVAQILMFLSPVFYPIEIVPVKFQSLYAANPLTGMITEFREVVLWGNMPNWLEWGKIFIISFVVFVVGYWIFRKCKGAFADVI
ncbi:ABC transporter permease [Paenibacillus sp. LPE1-1-1.1]|uniref:ABC transporter permease n=1 Tax=Paenibacillus sp. LPE1-1-1.1 TaxID=3135230 RepID=UPI003429020B